jgi:hypothetical protein
MPGLQGVCFKGCAEVQALRYRADTPMKQSCPLCKSEADCDNLGLSYIHFNCKYCTEFVIARKAMPWFAVRLPNVLTSFSTGAKEATLDGMIYVITRRLQGLDYRLMIEGQARYPSEVFDIG